MSFFMTNGKIRLRLFEMANVVLTIRPDNRPCQGLPHNSIASGPEGCIPSSNHEINVGVIRFEELARYLVTVQIFLV